MRTAIVILNYNTKEYLRKFLPGLIASTEGLDAQVIVADNASRDGSVEMMKEQFPSVPLMVLEENYGFTGGYNRALKDIDAEFFVLMNSDIEVPGDWLKPLLAWMDSHPDCGACGPKLISYHDRSSFEYAGAAGGYIDRYGYPFCRGRILQKLEKDNGQYNSSVDVLWCSGACLMVRSSVWKVLGGLDDRFFAHMEEIDLCWRMQLAGWRVTSVPQSVVYHIGGGTLSNESPFKLRLNFRNNLLLLENNLPATFAAKGCRHPMSRTRRCIIVRMLLDGCSAMVYLLKGKWSFFKAVLTAHKQYRQLRTPGVIPNNPKLPEGLYNGWIVPKGLF
ncbi:MAG: glycosyltransferase family 2 protein [Bacteroidales bacterium]|nr:glycosyltransferase family 2 protein [Bacteroidales bacterium]